MNLKAYLAVKSETMRKTMRRLGYLAGALAFILAVLAFLVIDAEPWVWHKIATPQHYLAMTQNILHSTAKPPDQGKDKVRNIALTEDDLTAVVNYALTRKKLEGFAQATIFEKRMVILVSIKTPICADGCFLNLKLIADDAEPRAFIKQVKAGFIALPKPVVRVLFWWLTHTTRLGHYVEMTLPLLQQVRIGDGKLWVSLNWDREVLGQAQDLVADLADKERLRLYYAKLSEVVGQTQSRRFIGLSALFRPLFILAKERSDAEGGNAREENRALLLVLAAYANGKSLEHAIYTGMDAPTLARRDVLLSRRMDVAQHFTASAVMAMSGQREFADMVGLAKEFNDTHGGTGFSFTDLAADRAGASFGKMSVDTEESARRIQAILSLNSDEAMYMPTIKDLPENLSLDDFAKRFGDLDSPEFLELKKKIENRILVCPLYQ